MLGVMQNLRWKGESGELLVQVDNQACGLKASNKSDDIEFQMAAMTKELWALLVYDRENPVRGFDWFLISHGMRTRRCRSCSEAQAAFCANPPDFVVTDISLPDGTWEDVLKAARAVPVIVVSPIDNTNLYLDVLEKGARDFVVPPFCSADLAYIISAAIRRHSDCPQRSD